jgi:hypothetical protein
MLFIEHFHLSLPKFASQSLKSLDESSVIDNSFVLHIEKPEPCLALISLIFFQVGFLSYFFIDGDFHLFESINGDPIIEETVSVNHGVDEKLLSFNGDTAVDIQIILFELTLSNMLPICRSSKNCVFEINSDFFSRSSHASAMRVIIGVELSEKVLNNDHPLVG